MSVGVYVKGMGMPVCCYDCIFVSYFNGSCKASQDVIIDRSKWYMSVADNCPLVSIQTLPDELED